MGVDLPKGGSEPCLGEVGGRADADWVANCYLDLQIEEASPWLVVRTERDRMDVYSIGSAGHVGCLYQVVKVDLGRRSVGGWGP
eukprot:scaffold16983_cov152-Amphora_coffeaeformis.AAC.2